MKPSALLVTGVLVAATTTGCGGGGSSAPTNASEKEFCTAFVSVFAGTMSDPDSVTGQDIRDWGKELEKVGTPKGISSEERDGFEVFVDVMKDIKSDAKLSDIEDPDVSDKEDKQATAFLEYASTTCAQQMAESMAGG